MNYVMGKTTTRSLRFYNTFIHKCVAIIITVIIVIIYFSEFEIRMECIG